MRAGRSSSPWICRDSIDELAAVLGGKFLGDIHRFIDAHHRRDVLAMEHLVDGEPEERSGHHRHAMEIPIFGVALDLFIDVIFDVECAANQCSAKTRTAASSAVGGAVQFFRPSGRAFVSASADVSLRVPELIERLLQVGGGFKSC